MTARMQLDLDSLGIDKSRDIEGEVREAIYKCRENLTEPKYLVVSADNYLFLFTVLASKDLHYINSPAPPANKITYEGYELTIIVIDGNVRNHLEVIPGDGEHIHRLFYELGEVIVEDDEDKHKIALLPLREKH